jgi:hypothetical protein
MTSTGGFGIPGIGARVQTEEIEFIWGGDAAKGLVLRKSAVISSTCRDSGASTTTDLRAGLLLGVISSTGEYAHYDPDATDGTQIAEAILSEPVRILDFEATAVDRLHDVVVAGPVKGGQIQGIDDQARRQMSNRFIFDDDLLGRSRFCGAAMGSLEITGDTTLTAASHNGRLLVCTTADADLTLPAVTTYGFACTVLRYSNHELIITSAAGNDIVVGNDVAASTVTFTTSGQQIGLVIDIQQIVASATEKWLVTYRQPIFGTGVTGGYTLAIT